MNIPNEFTQGAYYRLTHLPKTEDIAMALFYEGTHGQFKKSGHEGLRQGKEYIELCHVTFRCNRPYIIDSKEYSELSDGLWYERNYAPLIMWQLPLVLDKLIKDNDSRQAILQFYDADKNELRKNDMICTMYVSLRLRSMDEKTAILDYCVNMRSSDIVEFRSDLKFHEKMRKSIANALYEKTGLNIWEAPIIWHAESIQCWDKDWPALKDEYDKILKTMNE